MKRVSIFIFIIAAWLHLHAQDKKPDAIIISKYGDEFRVRLSRILYDSLYFIASPYNSD